PYTVVVVTRRQPVNLSDRVVPSVPCQRSRAAHLLEDTSASVSRFIARSLPRLPRAVRAARSRLPPPPFASPATATATTSAPEVRVAPRSLAGDLPRSVGPRINAHTSRRRRATSSSCVVSPVSPRSSSRPSRSVKRARSSLTGESKQRLVLGDDDSSSSPSPPCPPRPPPRGRVHVLLFTLLAFLHFAPRHTLRVSRLRSQVTQVPVAEGKEVVPDEISGEKIANMFSWLNREENNKQDLFENVTEGLKRIYKSKLLPLEQYYQFHDFHSPQLDDPDFDAKPMILLVGQYSTGKTTFIKYLLEREFPGIRIGPEPTTDRFIAVMYDEKEGVIPGNALVVDPNKQFRPLSKFGNAFLNRFQCSTVASPVLKGISIVDTPGILSGEKQRVDRGYDFTGVLEWFAERVDRIILLFDAHKLDISDEFRRSIEALRGHDDKIRIVLNKADMIDHQQLMRVYGALMWSLGKVLQTPEVARVYIGSFWDQPLRYDVNRRLFEDEEQDLFKDMQSLPKNAALRKLNDLIKRARLAKVHAYIISALRKDMPSMFGKDNKKKELIKNLGQTYDQIQREQQISPGDFPDLKKMQESLAHHDFNKFNPLKPKLLEVVDKMLAEDIAKLMAMIPHEETTTVSEPLIKGGAFEGVEDQVSPFGYKRGEGIDAGAGEPEWIVNKERYKYDSIFESLGPQDGKITGAAAKSEMVKSKLPNSVLGKIWKLSDVNKDGFLDSDEFALAMHLINVKLEGYDLPAELPEHLIPPSKRDT
ncbi:EH domain-containing protein 1, partial [Temnothorax longispinosus]